MWQRNAAHYLRLQMSKKWKKRVRVATPWLLVLSLLLTGLVTVYLFSATSRPIPRSFTSWQAMGCGAPSIRLNNFNDSEPHFRCLSPCGRVYATVTRHVGEPIEKTVDVSVHDWTTKGLLCCIYDQPRNLERISISADKRFLALGCNDGSRLFDLSSGTAVLLETKPPWNASRMVKISPDSRTMIADLENGSVAVIDLQSQLVVKSMQLEPKVVGERTWSAASQCLFDQSGRPKLFYFEPSGIELWDIQTGQRDWRIQGKRSFRFASTENSNNLFWTVELGESSVTFRSISDGRVISQRSLPDADWSEPCLSTDGHFVVCLTSPPPRSTPFINLARHLTWIPLVSSLTGVDEQNVASSWTLLDSQRALRWCGIPGEGYMDADSHVDLACFRQDEPVLITANNAGCFEWDVPPRWQLFTSWVWVPVAVCAALATLLWRIWRKSIL